MKCITRLIILSCLCSALPQSLHAKKFASHMLITILDDSEPDGYRGEIINGKITTNLGASAYELWAALLEETSMILVNSSVVGYLMKYIETFEAAAQKEMVQEKEMIKTFNNASNNPTIKEIEIILKQKSDQYNAFFKLPTSINPQNWIKKRIGSVNQF
jgi:hypothetical protein